jgi:hypothetical protein
MSRKTVIWTVIVFVAITAGIVGFVLWDESRTSQRLAQETKAVGLTGTPTEWYDTAKERNVTGHTVTFAYTAGEKVYTRTMAEITWFDPAAQYKVCYNPEIPDDAKLYPASHVCGR